MKEKEMTNQGTELIDCFFCETPNACTFINGKGRVALGELRDGSEFGSHAYCGCLEALHKPHHHHKIVEQKQ